MVGRFFEACGGGGIRGADVVSGRGPVRRPVVALVVVAVAPPDALVASGGEGPSAVAGRRAIAGQDDGADVAAHAGVIQGAVELVHGAGAEGVAHLGAVKGHPHHRQVADPGTGGVAHAATVVGDVGQAARTVGKALDLPPAGGVEELRDARGNRPLPRSCGHGSRVSRGAPGRPTPGGQSRLLGPSSWATRRPRPGPVTLTS